MVRELKNKNKPTDDRIPFNTWSKKKIAEGKKFCTSRSRIYKDDRVVGVLYASWWLIRKYLYKAEGADSPEELQRVINKIHRKVVPDNQMFYVHFGDFKKEFHKRRGTDSTMYIGGER